MIRIQLDKFEGPLGLLLRLIEKEEMDITEISLAKVADQFVSYIRQVRINPEELADFLVIAAKLLLAKSRALLPYLYPEEDEEIEDLEKQLKMYKEFLAASKKVNAMLAKKKFMFPREFSRKPAMVNINSFYPPSKLKKEDLKEVYSALLERLRPPEKIEEETLGSKISIEEKILYIQESIIKKLKTNFSKILCDAKNKTEVIVSFLAVLELMRQREITLTQKTIFGEIHIAKMGDDPLP